MQHMDAPDWKVKIPDTSDWECALFGGHFGQGLVYAPTKGSEPNWFWRLMQFLAFGNRWRRSKGG